ncbi:unnamed protein product, partial [Allacma fusca]
VPWLLLLANLALTEAQVNAMFEQHGFGIAKFATSIRTDDEAFAFAVHTRLLNLVDIPICGKNGCQQQMQMTRRSDKPKFQGLQWSCTLGER